MGKTNAEIEIEKSLEEILKLRNTQEKQLHQAQKIESLSAIA